MLGDVCLWSAVALFLVLAVVDAGYCYRGRHRGLYVEQREWRPQPEYLTWEGSITLPDGFDPQTAVVTLTPPGGLASFPALVDPPVDWVGAAQQRIDEIKGMPTPWEDSDGRAGEWGDSAFDFADSAGLCVTASLWLSGDPEECGGECTCAMTESSMWSCEVHGV